MNAPAQPASPAAAHPDVRYLPTPLAWRAGLLIAAAAIGAAAYYARLSLNPRTGPRAQAGLGALCFLVIAAAFSTNLRAVSWLAIGMGIALQLLTALVALQSEAVQVSFRAAGDASRALLGSA